MLTNENAENTRKDLIPEWKLLLSYLRVIQVQGPLKGG